MTFPILPANGPSGYNLTRSLRFRSSATAFLNRTPASAGNRRTFTWSAWVKTSRLKGQIFTAGKFTDPAGDNYGLIMLNNSTSQLQLNIVVGGGGSIIAQTPAVFRDPSSWYHFVVAVDTTQATNSNGVKMYVNGVQQTLTFPAYTQNQLTEFNNTTTHNFGQLATLGDEYFDGYLAEVNFIDGQQLTPSSFGSTNATTGVWQPAPYTGSYGTNGFYLPFTSIGSASTSSYSGNFNGSSQYLTFPNSSNFAFGTAAFTVEFFINGALNNDKFILGGRSAIGTMHITTGGSGSTAGVLRYVGSSTIVSTNLITDSSYHHCAIVRDNSSNVKLYVDGALVASGTDTTNYTTTSGTWYIGTNDTSAGNNLLSAALSNLRVVKGTAVYTAAFTPPSAPLTAVSGTSLLTLQSSTIIDNSGNSVSISNTGTVVTSVSYPFVGNVGADFSGNNNNWSTNNISLNSGTTYDSMTDVPTLTSATAANYCVLNPLFNSTPTLSAGNLNYSVGSTSTPVAAATIGVSSGKWYWEVTATSAGNNIGIISLSDTRSLLFVGGSSNSWAYFHTGIKYGNSVGTSYGASYTTNDVIGVALDLTAGTITFYKNNTSQGTAFSSLSGTFFPACGNDGTTSSCVFNFGQRPFTYTPPTGFVALNTFNLPTSTIVKGNTVMDATLYTGTGASLSVTNTASFKPDLVWVKGRSGATDHAWYDSVRGVQKQLESNTTTAETTETTGLTAFGSAGFTVGALAQMNTNTATYVGWQWQAGQGTNTTNTSGTITSTVSVNASAGFSVVTWTANASANQSIGHGLGVAPSLVIVKDRTTVINWNVWFTGFTANEYLLLNSAAAKASFSTLWYQVPDSSKFYVGSTATAVNYQSGDAYVAYCWTPIAGYSSFGSYIGNGSTDGPFLYLGFRPKYLLLKCTTTGGAGYDWYVLDSVRNAYNFVDNYLYPNYSNAEAASGANFSFDFVSNGIKIRGNGNGQNQNGQTYAYACWAENPFKNALAR
jgi:hypothetical protein